MSAAMLRQLPGVLVATLVYGGGLIAGSSMPGVAGEYELAAAVEPAEAGGFWGFLSQNAPLLVLAAVGAVTAGLITLLLLSFNGTLMGSVLAEAHANGVLSDTLGAVVPHAPFELAATFLAGAVGFMPASVIVRLALGRVVYVENELKDAGLLLAGALVLITLAAAVEAWITPLAMNWTIGGT